MSSNSLKEDQNEKENHCQFKSLMLGTVSSTEYLHDEGLVPNGVQSLILDVGLVYFGG